MTTIATDGRVTINLPLGGMHGAGNVQNLIGEARAYRDPASIPDGKTFNLTNVLFRAGRLYKRPPETNETLTIGASSDFYGYTMWEDTTNYVTRMAAFIKNGTGTDMYLKNTTGETWSTAKTGMTTTGPISAYTNYKGVMYFTQSNETNYGVPQGLFSYNGTSINTAPLGGETLYGIAVQSFLDRIFLGYVKASVVNQLGTTVMYDPTGWTGVTTTTTNITNGSSVTGRITPTATTLSLIYKTNVYTVAAATTPTTVVFRSDFRSTSPTYAMPITTEVYYSQIWVANTAYTVGAIRVPTLAGGNGFRYRCTVSGTSANPTEPTWPTTAGTTVVDNTVTWICDGPDAIASSPYTIPSLSDLPNFSTVWTTATIAAMPQSAQVGVRIKFGTTAVPTITLAPIDISFKDGLTDGVVTKTNYGQQLTVGKFKYPFVNQESSATATVELPDDLYWTETADPNSIRASNSYRLREAPGHIVAMCLLGSRLIVFKRYGMWVFQGTGDPDIPIQLERFYANVGLIGSRAWTIFEDVLYFIGPNAVYSFTPPSRPKSILGDAMDWILPFRTLAEPAANLEAMTLCVDENNRDLYMSSSGSTGTGAFVMHLPTQSWSGITLGGTSTAIQSLIFNKHTGNIYGYSTNIDDINTHKCFRLALNGPPNATQAADDSGSNNTVTIAFKPMLSPVAREDIFIEEIAIYTAGQISGTQNVKIGVNYTCTPTGQTKFNTVTIPASTSFYGQRIVVPIKQAGPQPTIVITHTGDCGDAAFNISRAEVVVRPLRPERTLSTPTQVSATL